MQILKLGGTSEVGGGTSEVPIPSLELTSVGSE